MLVWFSCGGPSAVAVKKSIELYDKTYQVIPVNCDTRPSEHSDNYRFSQQVERWIGREIVYIRSDKYKTVDDVFEREKYMSGIGGARCTTELKKKPRLEFAWWNDIHVFGFTVDEVVRRNEFAIRNPDLFLKWVLIDLFLSKRDCLNILRAAGIEEPAMYQLGFDNNNCPGCVKAQSPRYWSMIRKHFPEVFKRRCVQSRAIGCKLVKLNGVRIFLDELPEGEFVKGTCERISCGPECGLLL